MIRGMLNTLALPWLRKKRDNQADFLPAALEIIETPASPAGRTTAALIILFFFVALLWASFGFVDIIATAQGRVMPTGRTKILQPFETGVVRAIHVQDGQTVKAGDVLIEIDPTINQAEHQRLEQELMRARLDIARLKALLGSSIDPLADFTPPDNADATQISLQRHMLTNQLEEKRAKLNGLDKQIAQSEGNHAAVMSTISKLQEAIPLLRKRYDMRRELAEEGYSSKLDALTVQQDLVEHEHEIKVQQARLREATGALAALQEQRKQAEAEFRRTNLNELAQAEQKAASLQEQTVQVAQRHKLQTLVSPVDGIVQQLAVHTEGGVVTPAQALLAIVPTDSKLEIEAMVSNRDIGFIRAGQQAAIKVDTFNFTKYGLLYGEVLTVSQDAIVRSKPADQSSGDRKRGAENESSEPSGQEYIYAARIALDQTSIQVDERLVPLSPGMAVTVEIKTGTRRIIEYLLSPLAKRQHEALRER
ncbi:MAG: HlyD family type I secretion periplasmic adaptor subunit [Alphaproteobacteria bacterium]